MSAQQVVPEYLIQRMEQCAHPHVDVRVIAAEVAGWHGRKPLRNPEGMFVRMVQNRSRERREAGVRLDAVRGAAQERQAKFMAEVLRLVATQQLAPVVVADMLANARSTGIGSVSTRLIDRLRRYGTEWPE